MKTALRTRQGWPSAPCIQAALLGALLLAGTAFAQETGCVELKTSAETEQAYVDEQGRQARRLVPAAKVVPGDEVIWTITAKNVCSKAAESIVIANPVPQHMSYVDGSALGVGTRISYSLNGTDFAAATALTVQAADGSARPARPAEYRAIRWTFDAPFGPGATAFVRYRALVN